MERWGEAMGCRKATDLPLVDVAVKAVVLAD